MPTPIRKVFISCVSDEFSTHRNALREYLSRADLFARIQEEFPQAEVGTLETLYAEISQHDAMIHVVGNLLGAIPPRVEVESFLASHPDFLGRISELRERIEDCSGITYTQWEALFAIHHQIPVFAYKKKGSDAHLDHVERLKIAGRYAEEVTMGEDFYAKATADLSRFLVARLKASLSNPQSDTGESLDLISPPELVIPNRVSDVIYKGVARQWEEILEVYRTTTGSKISRKDERLALVTTYDIARIRNVADSDTHLLFFDSSWLTHDYAFWNVSKDMKRWLRALGEVATDRAKTGKRTSRVFYWRPELVVGNSAIMQMADTVFAHLESGISVFLVHPSHWPSILDIQIFGDDDGLLSADFTNFDIVQLSGTDIEIGTDRFEYVSNLVRKGGALQIPLNTKLTEVVDILSSRCSNVPEPRMQEEDK